MFYELIGLKCLTYTYMHCYKTRNSSAYVKYAAYDLGGVLVAVDYLWLP